LKKKRPQILNAEKGGKRQTDDPLNLYRKSRRKGGEKCSSNVFFLRGKEKKTLPIRGKGKKSQTPDALKEKGQS